jgi:hypothetical protein
VLAEIRAHLRCHPAGRCVQTRDHDGRGLIRETGSSSTRGTALARAAFARRTDSLSASERATASSAAQCGDDHEWETKSGDSLLGRVGHARHGRAPARGSRARDRATASGCAFGVTANTRALARTSPERLPALPVTSRCRTYERRRRKHGGVVRCTWARVKRAGKERQRSFSRIAVRRVAQTSTVRHGKCTGRCRWT